MKIELTIKTDYLPTWGPYEGLRELVQNGKDAEVELGAKLTIDWYNDTVRIENDGCTLPHEALLLGHTTKLGRGDCIGRFGEGLKLGILALVRNGAKVKIRSGSEVWIPSIQHSEKFDAEVLVFTIFAGRKAENRVRVEVEGISKETWEGSKWKFRFMFNRTSSNAVPTGQGDLLLDPEMKGNIFVKGIYVATDSKLSYGFDLEEAELDRDRKMVNRWDFQYRAAQIIGEAMAKRPDMFNSFLSLLERQAPEVANITRASDVPESVRNAVVADFKAKHGENAVPVRNLSDSKDLDHLGKKGIVVSEALAGILSDSTKSLEELKQALKEEVTRKYGWSDLTDEEKRNLTEAIELVNAANVAKTSLDQIDVADFRDTQLLGLYKEGRILLAKKEVTDRDRCLTTLVHEASHIAGADGAKDHVATIEATWSGIVKALRK